MKFGHSLIIDENKNPFHLCIFHVLKMVWYNFFTEYLLHLKISFGAGSYG